MKGKREMGRARIKIPLCAAIFILLTTQANAQTELSGGDQAAANYALRLFMDACIPNMGRPDKVHAWATAKGLSQIIDPIPLGVFVGPGNGGEAWAVPAEVGSFALSIRSATKGCTVYARAADPAIIETDFRKIVEGAARPGVTVQIIKDEVGPSPYGNIHTLAYDVDAPGAKHSFVFYMMTVQKPGGVFQAQLEVAVGTPP
jgi:hypothetical protein